MSAGGLAGFSTIVSTVDSVVAYRMVVEVIPGGGRRAVPGPAVMTWWRPAETLVVVVLLLAHPANTAAPATATARAKARQHEERDWSRAEEYAPGAASRTSRPRNAVHGRR